MKSKKQHAAPAESAADMVMKECTGTYRVPVIAEGPMVRTQIYLNRSEHDFLSTESTRRGIPMAAVIRALIDERMTRPADAWTNNSLLASPADPDFVGPEDGIINHDHYVYGTPKRFVKRRGQWVPAPELPEDYHLNEASQKAHDRILKDQQ